MIEKKQQGLIPEILDLGDLAELLRVSKQSAKALVDNGTIPGFRFMKGKYLFSKRQLIEVIEKGSQTSFS